MLRLHNSLTSQAEKRLLQWVCQRLPYWVTPDMLTLLGLAGAGIAFCGYWLADRSPYWLWLAIGGIILNWLGDSLDGSLARFRQAERPKYGFFVDHMTDTISMALIGLGIGVSPFADLTIGLVALIAYYLMMILSLITCLSTQVFRISFHGIGPTEIRLCIITGTLTASMMPIPRFAFGATQVTIYDIFILVLAALMFVRGFVQAIQTGIELSALDPRVRLK